MIKSILIFWLAISIVEKCNKMGVVIAVLLTILIGLLIYILYLDFKIKKLKK